MRQALKLHAQSHCEAATQIEAYAMRSRCGNLLLRYYLTFSPGLLMPPVTAPTRADELWRHTCFEAFVHASPHDGYYEFNFSPSTEWAAYRFNAYRTGMSVAENIAPQTRVRLSAGRFELRTCLNLAGLPDLPGNAPLLLGLSAVIEEVSGNKSYWALVHPPGKPDFHHSDCFALELPAP